MEPREWNTKLVFVRDVVLGYLLKTDRGHVRKLSTLVSDDSFLIGPDLYLCGILCEGSLSANVSESRTPMISEVRDRNAIQVVYDRRCSLHPRAL